MLRLEMHFLERRQQEAVKGVGLKKKQGSGLIDILGEAYILNKAKKQKEGKEQIERYRAYNAKKAADAALVAPAPVVGSGKRGRPKGSKNKKM